MPDPARERATTAISSSPCSAEPGRPGAARGRRGFDPSHGEDHHAKVLLDLEASLEGGSRSLTLRVPEIDPEGRVSARERVLNVRVPKGILPGQTIRLAGQGAPPLGRGTVRARQAISISRSNFSPTRCIESRAAICMSTCPWRPGKPRSARRVKTPTPGGVVDLKIPPGAQAGTKLRLRGRGIPASPPGDLYAVLQIALPKPTDDKGKAAYRALAEAMPFNPRANLGV